LGLVVGYRFSGKVLGGLLLLLLLGAARVQATHLVDLPPGARTWNFVFFCSYLVVMNKSFEYNLYILSLVGSSVSLQASDGCVF
jgi:hypothetical protein